MGDFNFSMGTSNIKKMFAELQHDDAKYKWLIKTGE
jgi:hypothetical protein